MTNNSNSLGRAYEYACIIQLAKKISLFRKVKVSKNSSFLVCKNAWENINTSYHKKFMDSAGSAVETLFELEPLILENDNDVLELILQRDVEGEIGDVRDCVILRRNIEWEIGLSIKHNHFAVKHSRLAKNLDFGDRWFGMPCSKKYWDEIKPIFDYLETEKNKKSRWGDLPNKKMMYMFRY